MLNEAVNAGFEEGRSLVGRHYRLVVGAEAIGPAIGRRAWRRLDELQETIAVAVGEFGERRYWLYRDRIWWEREDLGPADVEALADERLALKRRRLERAHGRVAAAAVAGGDPARGQAGGLRTRRRSLRRVRLAGAAPVRPRDPARPRRIGRAGQPAAALRRLQPRQGSDPRLTPPPPNHPHPRILPDPTNRRGRGKGQLFPVSSTSAGFLGGSRRGARARLVGAGALGE